MGDAYERGYVSAGITHLTKPLPHPSCISLRTIQRNPTWQAVEAVERASVVWVSDGSGSGGSWRPASKIREQGGGVDSKDNLQRSDPEEESRISDEGVRSRVSGRRLKGNACCSRRSVKSWV